MNLDAVLSPPEIDLLPERDLSSTVCVVFDVLRATSSMLTGLAHGCEAIRPVLTIEEAREVKAELWPEATLGGERNGERIDGFDLGNSPLEYRREDLRQIVTTTTNGTVALRACEKAKGVLAGALLNMAALEKAIRVLAPTSLLLVAAGTFRDLALEDVVAAGRLAAAFPEATLSDAARTALALYQQSEGRLEELLRTATNGQVLVSRGREDEVRWCATLSTLSVVGVMDREGIIRPWWPDRVGETPFFH